MNSVVTKVLAFHQTLPHSFFIVTIFQGNDFYFSLQFVYVCVKRQVTEL